MWNNKKIEEIKKELVMFQIQNNELVAIVKEQASRISDLEKLPKTSPSSGIISRLEDLEIWRAKLHELAVTHTPAGKEKLTNMGRKLFGNRG